MNIENVRQEKTLDAALYLATGGTVKETAERYGLSQSRIYQIAHWFGVELTGNKIISDEQKERITESVLNGTSFKEIARRYGVTRQAISALCKKEGLHSRYNEFHQNPHICPVCGAETDNKKYCSYKCRKQAENKRHNAKRRAVLESAIIDADISLDGLIVRDKNVCYICGEQCDKSDGAWRSGTFRVGGKYPTIDHVIPLSKGGTHSWDNIRLACQKCNSAKGAKICPPLEA